MESLLRDQVTAVVRMEVELLQDASGLKLLSAVPVRREEGLAVMLILAPEELGQRRVRDTLSRAVRIFHKASVTIPLRCSLKADSSSQARGIDGSVRWVVVAAVGAVLLSSALIRLVRVAAAVRVLPDSRTDFRLVKLAETVEQRLSLGLETAQAAVVVAGELVALCSWSSLVLLGLD
jgi:hypothetical protein